VATDRRTEQEGRQKGPAFLVAIFFGSTAERVLRFVKRPVLCVPPEEDHKS
jgi:nucleotide-binding universal stress UspA family protein